MLLVRNKRFIIIAVCSSTLNINFTKNLSQNSKEDEFDTWSKCFKMIYKDVCFENRKCAVLTDINKLTEKCTIKLLKSFVYTPKFLAFVRSAFSAFMSRPILESHVQFYQPFCTKHKCAGLQCLVYKVPYSFTNKIVPNSLRGKLCETLLRGRDYKNVKKAQEWLLI